MIKNIITEAVGRNRVVNVIIFICVGLGKTFTALAVIKYYESKNKSVLVLCPKKLANTVSKNATVIFFKLIDDSKSGIFLKIVQHAPNLAVFKTGCFIREFIFRNIF